MIKRKINPLGAELDYTYWCTDAGMWMETSVSIMIREGLELCFTRHQR